MKEKKAHRIKQDKETLSMTKNIEFLIFLKEGVKT